MESKKAVITSHVRSIAVVQRRKFVDTRDERTRTDKQAHTQRQTDRQTDRQRAMCGGGINR